MARRHGVLGRFLLAILIIIMLIAITGAIFEVFIAPDASKVESKYSDNDKVTAIVTSGSIMGVKPARGLARVALALYGYSNDSLTENIDTVITISYTETKDGKDTTYEAMVIYFDSISDANTARKGIKDKIKDNDKVTMFRGKSLVLGDEKAVMRYYYVIF